VDLRYDWFGMPQDNRQGGGTNSFIGVSEE
jgi:hypothetical protein